MPWLAARDGIVVENDVVDAFVVAVVFAYLALRLAPEWFRESPNAISRVACQWQGRLTSRSVVLEERWQPLPGSSVHAAGVSVVTTTWVSGEEDPQRVANARRARFDIIIMANSRQPQ